jgi:Fic family protein
VYSYCKKWRYLAIARTVIANTKNEIKWCICMNPKDFQRSTAGQCIKTPEGYWAFLPNTLPPKIDYDQELISLLSDADRRLGELSGTGQLLPNPYLLISPYVHREAVSSSRIEGTRASLDDLYLYEAATTDTPRVADVKEVRNYVLAMEQGLKLLQTLPISIRLIREIHQVLMQDVRGNQATPGELRRSQNWIGRPGSTPETATIVPPPIAEMTTALGEWEKYLHSQPPQPPLIQCALMHYQFEAIHPFLDGNGRVGRLLITFFLIERKHLTQPLLYLSRFFEEHREEYYVRLLAVSQKGDWRGWLAFFLEAVVGQAADAITESKKILKLNADFHKKISVAKGVPDTARRLVDEAFVNPFVSISGLSRKWNLPFNSVKNGVNKLVELGILEELPGRKRNRLFVAKKLMDLFKEDR